MSDIPTNQVTTSNQQNLHYEDGKVQEKVYGDASDTLVHKLVINFINRENEEVQTHFINAQSNLTLEECTILLEERLKEPFNKPKVLDNLEGEQINVNTPVSQLFSKQIKEKELFIFYDPIKAISKEKVTSDTKYESITKYSFLDDKKKVKVYLELEGIGEVSADNIYSRFLERSFEVKIHDYKGKNWIFAIPKTSSMIKISESKIIQKKDKIIISIGKIADSDNWSTLHRVKGVGSKQD